MFALLAAAALAATPGGALAEAREHLAKDRLDDVLFALQGVKLEGAAQQAEGAELLARAGQKAWKAKDDFLALQFAQMSLGHAPAHPGALELAARLSLAQGEMGAAEGYADRWLQAAPKEPQALLLRAQLAQQQGESQAALELLRDVQAAALSAPQRAAAEKVRKEAQQAIAQNEEARAELRKMEADLERAAVQASREERKAVATPATGRSGGVILYSTAWCGYCTKARAYLKNKRVDFVEKDIEKDPAAAQELSAKRAKAGIRSGGVPVIDVRGTLVLGFDQNRLDGLLR